MSTTRYIVIAPFCWGAGATEKEAVRNAKVNRVKIYEGKRGWRYILYATSDSKAYVDDMGSLVSLRGTTEEVKRVGKF